jgi:DNA-binding winged helix-turn-helix (wHTH) protein/tetratricopeptide (TPR) repeat protein
VKGGQVIPLAPKAHDVLVALVRNAGRLVTKRELLQLIWPESFVEEGILSVHISALRKALGEGEGEQRRIETVARVGYRFIDDVTQTEGNHGERAERWSIAVLPAQSSTTEASDNEQFMGLAIADALIERLGAFAQITVRPTSAVRTYTEARHDPAAVGRSLRVDAVLDSHFLRTADRIRVSAQLVLSRDGTRLWSSEYDQPATEITGIADAIVESVAAHLGLSFHGNGRTHRQTRPPIRPEVYQLFGRGRSHLLSGSMFEVPKAVAAFQAAIEVDPTYAAAHAGLALACCAQAQFRVTPPTKAYGDATAAALRAMAMGDSCADAQVAVGAVLFLSEWDWVGAKRSLERALELNPNHTEAYLYYGQLMEALGELEKGLEMKQRALERDPFSPLVHLQISLSYWNQHQYDDSIEWANKALELDPRHPHAREHLAGAYLKKGDFDRHMAENIKHAELHGVPAAALEPLKQAYAAGGRAAVVRLFLKRASSQPEVFPAIALAVHYAEAGQMDAAFRHLKQAIESRDPWLVHLAVGPQWDSFRTDLRFNQCLARMGLEPGA